MRRRYWTGGAALAAVVAVGGGAAVVGWNPLILPGPHRVDVFGLDLKIPATGGRPLTGMCDADSYYVRDGGDAWCLTLNGPLGAGHVTEDGGRVTVPAADVPALRALAGDESALVLQYGHTPIAVVQVADLVDGGPVSATRLS